MTLVFRSLTVRQPLAGLCAGTDDPEYWLADLTGCLADGTVRPEWCWQAVDGDRVFARLYWWGMPESGGPRLLVPMRPYDVDAAAALVAHSRDALALDDAWCTAVVLDSDVGVQQAHQERVALLAASGFESVVDRVRLAWLPEAGVPASGGQLRFVPAETIAEPELLELFASVGDSSLDYRTNEARAARGRAVEAARRLAEAREYLGRPGWFSVGVAADGALAGYVVSALADVDRPILAELGVAATHRGSGYTPGSCWPTAPWRWPRPGRRGCARTPTSPTRRCGRRSPVPGTGSSPAASTSTGGGPCERTGRTRFARSCRGCR